MSWRETIENVAGNGQDLRVIMVKLADRLHNMRTLQHLRPDKQLTNCQRNIGDLRIWQIVWGSSTIKWELEDLSLRYLNPVELLSRTHLMNSKRTEREKQYSGSHR